MTRVPFVDLRRQYEGIKDEVDAAIKEVLDNTAFIGGDSVRFFEREFAESCGAEHAIGVGNGTDALEIILEALFADTVGGEVIVPANSFVATSEAVSRANLAVVFADVDPGTMLLDLEDVQRRITDRTVAIVAVHLYGQVADFGRLCALCSDRGIALIEDAAQAHGAQWEGHTAGALGVAAAFSFYPGKNLGAYGDAGAITCNDPELANRMRMIANHGRLAKYDHAMEGRNSRLDGLQAAVLRVKLGHIQQWTEHRRHLAAMYREYLAGVQDLELPIEVARARHVYHLFVCKTDRRDELRNWLAERGVATGVHYPIALPRLAAYAAHPQHEEEFVAADLAPRLISLPMADSVTADEVRVVCDRVREFYGVGS